MLAEIKVSARAGAADGAKGMRMRLRYGVCLFGEDGA